MDKISDSSLFTQLRSATWHRHENLEKLPFVLALVAGTLPLQSYIGQLRGLAIIFSSMESAVTSATKTNGERVQSYTSQRFSMLSDDLSYFAPQMIPDILPAVRCALDASTQMRLAAPGKLLGYLYVLQGTMRGNQVHLPDIIRCFDLDDRGTCFYRGYGADTDTVWEEFCSIANCADRAITSQAILGAAEMYNFMERFHQLLYPLPELAYGFTSAGLNPEAGDHSVPQEPELLQAAIRVAGRCRDEFSYYERRYGERGRRFAESDVAWLAALVNQDEDVILEQVLWLGRVLSVRGMPLLLLERQLELLHEELGSLAKHPSLENLQSAFKKIKLQRQRLASQEQFESACHAVTELLHHVAFPDLPVVLVAAHLDMQNGIPECQASLVSWLIEKSMMTQTEVEAVVAQLDNLLCNHTKQLHKA